MSVAKAEIRRVLKVCRQVQDQPNKSTFALKSEGGAADLTEINNAIADLTSQIENLENSCAEVIGIEQLKCGFSVGLWNRFPYNQIEDTTVDGNAMVYVPKVYFKNEKRKRLDKTLHHFENKFATNHNTK